MTNFNDLPLVANLEFNSDINDSLGNFEFTNLGAYLQNYTPKDNYQLIERDGRRGIQLTKGTAQSIWYNTIVFKSNIKPLDVFKVEFDFYTSVYNECLFGFLNRSMSEMDEVGECCFYISSNSQIKLKGYSNYNLTYYTLTESMRNKWNTCRIECDRNTLVVYINNELAINGTIKSSSISDSRIIRVENFYLCGYDGSSHDATIKNLKIYGYTVFIGVRYEITDNNYNVYPIFSENYDVSNFTYSWYSHINNRAVSTEKNLLNYIRNNYADISYELTITDELGQKIYLDVLIPKNNDKSCKSMSDFSNDNFTIKTDTNNYVLDATSDHIVELADNRKAYAIEDEKAIFINHYRENNTNIKITTFKSIEFSLMYDKSYYNDVYSNNRNSNNEYIFTILELGEYNETYINYDYNRRKTIFFKFNIYKNNWCVAYGYYSRHTLLCENINPFEWHHFYLEIGDGVTRPNSNFFNLYIDGKRYGFEIPTSSYPTNISFRSRSQCSASTITKLYTRLLITDIKTYDYYPYRGETFDPPPYIDIPIPKAIITANKSAIHTGDTVILNGANSYISDGSALSYMWDSGETTPTITRIVNDTSIVSLTVTSTKGYSDKTNYLLQPIIEPIVIHDPTVIITANKDVVVMGETIILDASSSYCQGSSISGYLWSNGETTASIEITPTDTTIISVTVYAENGRSTTKSYKVIVISGDVELMKYLPTYWHNVVEMKEIQKKTLNYMLYDFNVQSDIIESDAYIDSMSVTRLTEWENALYLTHLGDEETRKLILLSYFKKKGKLNEEMIRNIVKNFANNADCFISFENSTINVLIRPKSENETVFTEVEKILNVKKPAHLGLNVKRVYSLWGDIKRNFNTWNDVKNKGTWNDIKLFLE